MYQEYVWQNIEKDKILKNHKKVPLSRTLKKITSIKKICIYNISTISKK